MRQFYIILFCFWQKEDKYKSPSQSEMGFCIGRSLNHPEELVDDFHTRGIEFIFSLYEEIDTTIARGKSFFLMMGTISRT